MEEVFNVIGDLEEGRGGNDGEERRRLERQRERVTVRTGEAERESVRLSYGERV